MHNKVNEHNIEHNMKFPFTISPRKHILNSNLKSSKQTALNLFWKQVVYTLTLVSNIEHAYNVFSWSLLINCVKESRTRIIRINWASEQLNAMETKFSSLWTHSSF